MWRARFHPCKQNEEDPAAEEIREDEKPVGSTELAARLALCAEAAADASRDVTVCVGRRPDGGRRSIFHSPGRRSFLLRFLPPISFPLPPPLPLLPARQTPLHRFLVLILVLLRYSHFFPSFFPPLHFPSSSFSLPSVCVAFYTHGSFVISFRAFPFSVLLLRFLLPRLLFRLFYRVDTNPYPFLLLSCRKWTSFLSF